MQLALGNNLTFICFGIGNLSNFAVIKSLQKFGGCLVDNNAFLLLKASFKFFVFNFIQVAMEFFEINIVGIVGSDKCNVIVIFSLKFWLEYFYKTDMLWIWYDMLWMFCIK